MQPKLAKTDAEILDCFAVMQELRPHLIEREFVDRVRRQQQQGYQLLFLAIDGTVQAVAGFRILECLSRGKFLYVDDLVTHATGRSQGYGEQLVTWLIDYAKQQNCTNFELDSGVQRFAAHRFYFRQRMVITCYHFARELDKT